MASDNGRPPAKGVGGGLNDRVMQPATEETLEGSGGSIGGGTRAGAGDPSGGEADLGAESAQAVRIARPEDREIVRDAAALGAGPAATEGPVGNTLGSALGSGAGRDVGSGTPGDKGELGGGAPLGQQGGAGPEGSASPGGDHRG